MKDATVNQLPRSAHDVIGMVEMRLTQLVVDGYKLRLQSHQAYMLHPAVTHILNTSLRTRW